MFTTIRFFKNKFPDPVNIEILRPREIETLAALARQTYDETYPNYFTPQELNEIFGVDFIHKQLPREFEDRNCLYLTVRANEKMVGYAKLIFKPDASVLLDKLYFLKDYQGRGLGAALLSACNQEAENRQCTVLELKVWVKNEKAIAFYKKHGFVSDGSLHPYLHADGSASGEFDYLMTRKLPALGAGYELRRCLST